MLLTKKNRKVAGAIPIYEQDSVVLVSNSKGNLIFPKGGVKKNETFQNACKREAMEEGGIEGVVLDVEPIKKRKILFYILKVLKLLDNYDEESKRERIILKIDDVFCNDRVPPYVKKLLREYMALKDAKLDI